MQSNEEIFRIFDEYQRGFAPADLVLDADNGKMIADFVAAKWGIFSISYMIEAEKTLGAQLKRKPQPTPLQIEVELANKGNARMKRDYADSIAPQSFEGVQERNRRKALVDNAASCAKELKNINSQIETEIGNFSVGHASGHQDYGRTDSGKQTLRSVRDQHPRNTPENAKVCLSAVRTAKAKL